MNSAPYTDVERRTLEPVRRKAERQALSHSRRCDVFLCHAWDDHDGSAKVLHDLLESHGLTVWFNENDFVLGHSFIPALDWGLTVARIDVVLMTPALCKNLRADGIGDNQLSALIKTNRVIVVDHGTTFEALWDVSPLLALRSGLSIQASSTQDVAAKIADAVRIKELSSFRRRWLRVVNALSLGSSRK